jgi:hypothetical protein
LISAVSRALLEQHVGLDPLQLLSNELTPLLELETTQTLAADKGFAPVANDGARVQAQAGPQALAARVYRRSHRGIIAQGKRERKGLTTWARTKTLPPGRETANCCRTSIRAAPPRSPISECMAFANSPLS